MPDSLSQEDIAISESLVAARLTAAALPDFPGQLPETLESAYAIQTESIARWRDEVSGWKVAMISPADRARLSAERIAGPIFRSFTHEVQSGSCKTVPIYEGGFAAVEAEFILELGVALEPSARDYSDEELVGIVSAMYVGVEIASSPMAAVNKLGPTCAVSDFGNNAGLLVGPEIPDWSSRPLESLPATVTVDGVVVGNGSADAIPGGPLQALRFLITLCGTRGIVLPKGAYISTGAATGVHDVQMNSKSKVDFGPFGGFDMEFEPMTPQQ